MGTLRIVAGRFRGRRLRVAPGASIRPTSERVREALFNILGQDLTGFDVLELFAGTGALGFEALSRGARRVLFVESDPKIAAVLRASAAVLGVDREARVVVGRVEQVLDRARLGGPYHVILADPPYLDAAEAGVVEGVDAGGLLRLEGTLVVEREKRTPPASGTPGLKLVRSVAYGRTALDFFKYRNPPPAQE